jgi:hypothetical protein
MVWFQSVERKIPDDMSAAPAMARKAIASGSGPASPNAATAAPPVAALTAIARPCRRTRLVQPLVSALAAAGRDRDLGHHRSRERDGLPGVEQPELAVPAQRPDVERAGPEEAEQRLKPRCQPAVPASQPATTGQ